jgi:hypothetical protein
MVVERIGVVAEVCVERDYCRSVHTLVCMPKQKRGIAGS